MCVQPRVPLPSRAWSRVLDGGYSGLFRQFEPRSSRYYRPRSAAVQVRVKVAAAGVIRVEPKMCGPDTRVAGVRNAMLPRGGCRRLRIKLLAAAPVLPT